MYPLQVSVRYFTVLRELTSKREETLQLEENGKVTVATVLKTLSDCYGKDFSNYICDAGSGEVRGFLQFFVNGHSIQAMNGLETELRSGDVLAIVPPVGGG